MDLTWHNPTQHTSPDRQPAAGSEPEPEPEPEADPVPEPSDPNLTQPPPPSYQVASNFPSRDLKADLPPPYPGPGGSGTTAPLPYTGASDAADPPPASHGYQLSTAAPDTGAWALLD